MEKENESQFDFDASNKKSILYLFQYLYRIEGLIDFFNRDLNPKRDYIFKRNDLLFNNIFWRFLTQDRFSHEFF